MPSVKKIHHVALATADMETALAFWRDALGMQVAERREAPQEAAEIAFLPLGESELELVQPTEADTGLAKFLQKRGPGMHHVCLEVDDLDGMLAQLREKGVELINETPRRGADGKRYAFIHPRSAGGVLVELYETP